MPNEKSNDEFYWRNKLIELKNLPGESFNKEPAWNKLSPRLHNKSSKKIFAWYWAAAAVLLFVLIAPFLTRQKKEAPIAKKATLTNQPQKIVATSSDDDKSSTVQIVNINSVKKKHLIVTKKVDKKGEHEINKNITGNFRLPDTVSNRFAQQNLYSSLHSMDTIQKAIALTTEIKKKKLKVVHINELGDATQEDPIVRSTDTHAFQLKFANQEVFVNHSVNSKATEFAILKTKISQTK